MYRHRSLASQLKVVVDGVAIQQARHFRTALGGREKVLRRAVMGGVKAILDGGSDLVMAELEGLAESVRKGLLDKQRPAGRFNVQLELEIAKRYTLRTDLIAQRCIEVARLALTAIPGTPARRFLSRVGRTYMLGLYPESVIMCRAALEQAITEKYELEKKPFPPPIGKSEIGARLAKAEDLGWLTRKEVNLAKTVLVRGNKAVHEDPTVTTDAIGTIETTLLLLKKLYGVSPQDP